MDNVEVVGCVLLDEDANKNCAVCGWVVYHALILRTGSGLETDSSSHVMRTPDEVFSGFVVGYW